MMIVVADVGGTKVDVALFDEGGGLNHQMIRRQTFFTDDHSGIIDVLKNFNLGEIRGLKSVCIGVAGPVQSRVVRLTNQNWVIDADGVERVFAVARVDLVNDMMAHVLGAAHSPLEDRLILQRGTSSEAGNIAVVAPGTGLGEGLGIWNESEYLAVPCEGGHSSFSPTNDLEVKLLNFARQKHSHVSSERLISGKMGFATIIDYYLNNETLSDSIAKDLRQALEAKSVGAEIIRRATEGEATCLEIANVFLRMLGSEAANLCLKSMAMSGIYLCGGIVGKMLPLLEGGAFLEGLRAKGRYADFMARIPVFAIKDDQNALRGLAHFAKKKLQA